MDNLYFYPGHSYSPLRYINNPDLLPENQNQSSSKRSRSSLLTLTNSNTVIGEGRQGRKNLGIDHDDGEQQDVNLLLFFGLTQIGSAARGRGKAREGYGDLDRRDRELDGFSARRRSFADFAEDDRDRFEVVWVFLLDDTSDERVVRLKHRLYPGAIVHLPERLYTKTSIPSSLNSKSGKTKSRYQTPYFRLSFRHRQPLLRSSQRGREGRHGQQMISNDYVTGDRKGKDKVKVHYQPSPSLSLSKRERGLRPTNSNSSLIPPAGNANQVDTRAEWGTILGSQNPDQDLDGDLFRSVILDLIEGSW